MTNVTTSFVQNLDDCIKVLMSAGKWRAENDILYSPIWDPKLICKKTYLDEFYADRAYVLYINGEPVATATLADPSQSKLDTWKEKLGGEYYKKDCLYVDDLAVVGPKIGQGMISILTEQIEKFATKNNYTSLRLDIDARLGKLRECYAKQGFVEVASKDVRTRTSLFMEKQL